MIGVITIDILMGKTIIKSRHHKTGSNRFKQVQTNAASQWILQTNCPMKSPLGIKITIKPLHPGHQIRSPAALPFRCSSPPPATAAAAAPRGEPARHRRPAQCRAPRRLRTAQGAATGSRSAWWTETFFRKPRWRSSVLFNWAVTVGKRTHMWWDY